MKPEDKAKVQQALEALEYWAVRDEFNSDTRAAITALRQLLEQPAALSLEDSLRVTKVCCGDYANCHAPCTPRGRWQAQPAAWVGLTDEEVDEWTPEIHSVVRAIEAKLREKNGGAA